jgi:hypothetical protein
MVKTVRTAQMGWMERCREWYSLRDVKHMENREGTLKKQTPPQRVCRIELDTVRNSASCDGRSSRSSQAHTHPADPSQDPFRDFL